MFHHRLKPSGWQGEAYLWEEKEIPLFNELIVSWNGSRPHAGGFVLSLAVRIEEKWSAWYPYARWEASGQSGGDIAAPTKGISVNQDILSLEQGTVASGFRVKVEAFNGASTQEFNQLHVCATQANPNLTEMPLSSSSRVKLDVPPISQMLIDHPRRKDLCSPTSTSAVVGYLLGTQVDPLHFAHRARDEAFDIFGNWVLNTAHASSLLGSGWSCWVERVAGFRDIYQRLVCHTPVVVSVKGELRGAPLPYANGHLIVVRGFDPSTGRVLCIDPAFASQRETEVEYAWEDFMEAWSRRRRLAYLFVRD
jgi:hypothetical protein